MSSCAGLKFLEAELCSCWCVALDARLPDWERPRAPVCWTVKDSRGIAACHEVMLAAALSAVAAGAAAGAATERRLLGEAALGWLLGCRFPPRLLHTTA